MNDLDIIRHRKIDREKYEKALKLLEESMEIKITNIESPFNMMWGELGVQSFGKDRITLNMRELERAK